MVWTNGDRLAIAAVAPDGVHLSAAPTELGLPLPEIPGGAAVACSSAGCVVGLNASTPYVMEQPPSGGLYALRLTADGAPAGGVTPLLRDPSAYSVKVMLRDGDATIFYGSGSAMYAQSLATGRGGAIFAGGPGMRPHPIAVIDDGLYWSTGDLLRWSRPDALHATGSFVDVDATEPAALAVTSRVLLVVRWVFAPPFGYRLYLRTLARPDVPPPPPSRRRAAR